MISRIYTVMVDDEERVYKGFDRKFTEETKVVAVILIEGEEEVYALDDNDYAKEQFKKYLEQSELKEFTKFIGFFNHA